MAHDDTTGTSVVVVGGGFAGLACTKRLGRRGVRVTLVDQHNYNQFQPLLYQVATAQVPPSGVARPLRDTFRRYPTVDVKMAVVTGVDPATCTVTCEDGTTFRGDYLVLATGSEPAFFHTRGAATHALPLYSLADAERLRSRIFGMLEDVDRDPDLVEQGALDFVVVGAGATGVETAGALADLFNEVVPVHFRDLDPEAARVHVVDPGTYPLAPFSERAHGYARRVLEERGVRLELGVSVTEVGPDKVVLSDGREIRTRTVVWAGGVQAAGLASRSGLRQGHGGRIEVEPDLTVPGFPRVYALGDTANTPGPGGRPSPQLGSVALQTGRWAARNILAEVAGRPRARFRYRDRGIMAMVGRNAAVVEVGRRRRELRGVVAFVAWLGVHAWLLPGARERTDALRAWLWDYLTASRTPALIDRPDAARVRHDG